MKKFLIPLAAAIAVLMSRDPVTAAVEPSYDFLQADHSRVSIWDDVQPACSLTAMIPDSVSSLVLAKSSSRIHMTSHGSHRSHSSHRSHRSGR